MPVLLEERTGGRVALAEVIGPLGPGRARDPQRNRGARGVAQVDRDYHVAVARSVLVMVEQADGLPGGDRRAEQHLSEREGPGAVADEQILGVRPGGREAGGTSAIPAPGAVTPRAIVVISVSAAVRIRRSGRRRDRRARLFWICASLAPPTINPMLVGAFARSVRVVRRCCVCSKRMRDGPKSNAVPSKLLIPISGFIRTTNRHAPRGAPGAYPPLGAPNQRGANSKQRLPPSGTPNQSGANGKQRLLRGRSVRTGGMAVNVDLAGRVAVVSGASAGIGRAIAQ